MDRTQQIGQRLEFACDAARRAGQFILEHYNAAGLQVEYKGDRSPVTVADRGAEELLRNEIAQHFPGDGVLGEELPETASASGFRWILDPIDGTKAFVHGVPQFGTLIGLEDNGELVLGVCRFPALDEMIYGALGRGAWWQFGAAPAARCRVSSTENLSDALFCFTEVSGWGEIGRADAFARLCQSTRIARGWGDCYGHMLVATGRADVMVDPLMNLWDAAALLPIVQEAGGHFLDWQGRPVADGGNGVSVNPALRQAVLEILAAHP